MWYWIIDIIADGDREAMGRLAVIATVLMGAALLGWLFLAF